MTAERRSLTAALRPLLLAALPALILFAVASRVSAGEISYDPYADAVQGVSGPDVDNAVDAIGAPDGRSAEVTNRNDSLTLDLGSGEEGTGALRLHLGSIAAQTQIQVTFLDGELREIKSETRTLLVLLGASSQDFAYSYKDEGKAYRYARLTSKAANGFRLDAIQALAYVGSTETMDTDGDGRADRLEERQGTDPKVVDEAPPEPAPAPSPAPTDGEPAPTAATDTDGDGVPDRDDAVKGWEKYGWLILVLGVVAVVAYLHLKGKKDMAASGKSQERKP